MDITFGKKDTHEAEFIDKMMEFHEEIMIWTIKISNSNNEIEKKYC